MGKIYNDITELAGILRDFRRHSMHWLDRGKGRGRCPDKVVCTSGGFDPLHVGHVRCIQGSAKLGDSLVVIVNGDGFLAYKKGYAFMAQGERMELVAAIKGVDYVVAWDDGSQNVAGALSLLRPDVFAKGGDRSSPSAMAPEELAACEFVGCEIVYGVGGTEKTQSSSNLLDRWARSFI